MGKSRESWTRCSSQREPAYALDQRRMWTVSVGFLVVSAGHPCIPPGTGLALQSTRDKDNGQLMPMSKGNLQEKVLR